MTTVCECMKNGNCFVWDSHIFKWDKEKFHFLRWVGDGWKKSEAYFWLNESVHIVPDPETRPKEWKKVGYVKAIKSFESGQRVRIDGVEDCVVIGDSVMIKTSNPENIKYLVFE